MTSWVVADSGLYLAVVLNETHAALANALIKSWVAAQYQVAAPYLFKYEFISVIRKRVARGAITFQDGQTIIDDLPNHPVETFANELLLQRAYELASEFNRPAAYDSFYLALAEHLGCEFWTADLRLFNAVGAKLMWVKWIGNFELPQPSAQP
jgi:predicted nucleic acid-binding protein